MSGHSKWSTIKRKKAASDAKRSKIFTRLLKEVQVAAKLGGGNPDGNPRLKAAIQTAKANSVPADNIERAIKRGTGDLEGVDYTEITYEGYGPGGVAILIKALTDNKNRTVAEVRHALTKCGGSLGGTNAVAHIFTDKGIITLPKSEISEEKIFDLALDAGAEDIEAEDEFWKVTTSVQDFDNVRSVLEGVTSNFEAEIQPIPSTTVKVCGKEAQQLLKLLDMLDDLDDVQQVIANFDIDDSELEAAAQEGAR
ncbi:MAG: YebC/PmpR family DNA-binding transcriptional regulator [Candidatus Dadabacteria bacterium]|nr:MAG: YebC/PmpR family DNA-binding transcriptional regulator [Candidatus Dadabacteria bacterium]